MAQTVYSVHCLCMYIVHAVVDIDVCWVCARSSTCIHAVHVHACAYTRVQLEEYIKSL